MLDLTLRVFVLLTAILQIAFPFFVNPFREGPQAFRSGAPSQIEPAGYAFSIWGPIYLLALGYAAWQLTPVGRADPVTARIAPLAIALYVGSSLWLAAAKYGPFWATMPILAVMALCASLALVISTAEPSSYNWRTWAVVLPFGVYAGWTVCAMFVNIAEVAPAFGFNRFGLSIHGYGVLSIIMAALAAGVVLWLTRGNPVFAGTVLWALIAIVVAAWERGADGAISTAATTAIVAVLVLAIGLRVWDKS